MKPQKALWYVATIYVLVPVIILLVLIRTHSIEFGWWQLLYLLGIAMGISMLGGRKFVSQWVDQSEFSPDISWRGSIWRPVIDIFWNLFAGFIGLIIRLFPRAAWLGLVRILGLALITLSVFAWVHTASTSIYKDRYALPTKAVPANGSIEPQKLKS